MGHYCGDLVLSSGIGTEPSAITYGGSCFLWETPFLYRLDIVQIVYKSFVFYFI